MRPWQERYNTEPGTTYTGEGYVVKAFYNGGLQYTEGDRRITFLGEMVDATTEKGRTWLIFPTMAHIVAIPSEVYWDGGPRVDRDQIPLILERIERGFRARKRNFDLVYTDAPYVYLKKGLESIHGKQSES